jgi:hypothetical protein
MFSPGRLPGTRWCGPDGGEVWDEELHRYESDRGAKVCVMSSIDGACRRHDHCAVWAPYSVGFVLACECDYELYEGAVGSPMIRQLYAPESSWPCLRIDADGKSTGQLLYRDKYSDLQLKDHNMSIYRFATAGDCSINDLTCNLCPRSPPSPPAFPPAPPPSQAPLIAGAVGGAAGALLLTGLLARLLLRRWRVRSATRPQLFVNEAELARARI